MYSLLETIDTPDDLRKLERDKLPQLANQLRAFLVESVSKTGGHLSSNLGTVELTIAAAVEPHPFGLARACRDRRRAREHGERIG